MNDDETFDEPSDVAAIDGDVKLDGPDGVDVKMTPAAAIETSDRMLTEAARAQGQRIRKGRP